MHVNTGPWGIAASPTGGAWFTENRADNSANWYGNRIAFVDPSLGVNETTNLAFQNGRTTVDNLRYDAKPKGIAVTAEGKPWFVEADNGNPGYRVATWDGGAYTEYFPPCAAAQPCSGTFTGSGLQDVAIAADGALWYTNAYTHSIGRMVPGGTVTEYKLSEMATGLGAGVPGTIKRAADGTLWIAVNGGYSAPAANALVKIDPTDLTKTVFGFGSALQPFDVAPDTKGNVWVSGSPQTAAGAWLARLPGVIGAQPDPLPVDPGNPTPVVTPVPTPVPSGTTLTPGVTATATISKPTVNGDSIDANQICVGPPQDKCSLVYLIQTHEYVAGFPGVKGSAAKVKTFTIGKKTVTLKGGQKAKVTVKLNALGRKLYKKKKHFKATLTVTQTVTGQKKPKTVLKKNVTFKR